MVRRHAPNSTIRRLKEEKERHPTIEKERGRRKDSGGEKQRARINCIIWFRRRTFLLFRQTFTLHYLQCTFVQAREDRKFIIIQNGRFIDEYANNNRLQEQRMRSFQEKQVLNERSTQEEKGTTDPTLAQEVKHVFCRLWFTDYDEIYG